MNGWQTEPTSADSAAGSATSRKRKRNVFVNSATGGRVLSVLMLPWFLAPPPAG
jgi:hypothetical protein